MEVFIHDSARAFLSDLDGKIQVNIKSHIIRLAENPYSKQLDTKKLKGLQNKPNLFRLRVGEYRIIYFVQDEKILITEIMHRSKGYDF